MGEEWGKVGRKWVKNGMKSLQKTVLMHASAGQGGGGEALHYYQGFHDVASVFLLQVGEGEPPSPPDCSAPPRQTSNRST